MPKNNQITVRINFNGPVSQLAQDEFVRLLDEELGHTLNEQEQRWDANKQHCGWGMNQSLVTTVERVQESEE